LEPVYSKHSVLSTQSSTYPLARTPTSYRHILLLVYYKLFNENGPLKVRNAIYSNNPYIGRVDANDVPPPHTVSSLVGHMCAEEERGFGIDLENGDAYLTELFETISSPKSYNLRSQEILPLLSTDRPGSRPQDPLVLKVGYKGMLK
jgi:hypothetical protein